MWSTIPKAEKRAWRSQSLDMVTHLAPGGWTDSGPDRKITGTAGVHIRRVNGTIWHPSEFALLPA